MKNFFFQRKHQFGSLELVKFSINHRGNSYEFEKFYRLRLELFFQERTSILEDGESREFKKIGKNL